jgi:DNA polymerase III epsilon subunit-like protein
MIKLAIDVETTGFKPFWHDVITIGIAVFEDNEDTPIATFYDGCRPFNPANFDEGSIVAHGFTLKETLEWQSVRQLALKVLHFLKEFYRPNQYFPFLYHAQNNFDYMHTQSLFINAELQFSFYKAFKESETRSTLLEARKLGYVGNKLDQWANRLNRQFVHHNALDDAIMCGMVDNYLIKHGGQDALESITQQTPIIHSERILEADVLSSSLAKKRKRK